MRTVRRRFSTWCMAGTLAVAIVATPNWATAQGKVALTARMNLSAVFVEIGAPRLLVSVTNDSGTPVEGLTASHFTFEQLAGPTGIGGADLINKGVATPSRPGVYWFTLPLQSGVYVIAITMKGLQGVSQLKGQTLLKFTVP